MGAAVEKVDIVIAHHPARQNNTSRRTFDQWETSTTPYISPGGRVDVQPAAKHPTIWGFVRRRLCIDLTSPVDTKPRATRATDRPMRPMSTTFWRSRVLSWRPSARLST